MEHIHTKGDFELSMIEDDPITNLIGETNKILTEGVDFSIKDSAIPPAMVQKLENDVFRFSGFKTYHELKEASLLLRDDKGQIKSFNNFLQDVRTIDEKYNKNYLRAEYDFAIGSSQMASKWFDFNDDDERYNLQYRTAQDDKVRTSHAAMHNTTLPKSDDFWNKFYPPNDWGCRCTVEEVRASKYPKSDSEKANEQANNIMGDVKSNIFKYNPAKDETIFPPKHPYYHTDESEEVTKQINNLLK